MKIICNQTFHEILSVSREKPTFYSACDAPREFIEGNNAMNLMKVR